MIRAFVGIRIHPDIAERIVQAQRELKRSLTGVRWVAAENLHFTLKFFGAVPEEKIAPIADALTPALGPVQRFRIVVKGLGVFPDVRRARILWVGLESDRLPPLAEAVEASMEKLGFAREKRAFRPHLTIGRWREFERPSDRLRRAMERWRDYDFGATWADEVVLFQSVLKPEGAVYSALRRMSLSGAEPRI